MGMSSVLQEVNTDINKSAAAMSLVRTIPSVLVKSYSQI
jgi:hypothetical protein